MRKARGYSGMYNNCYLRSTLEFAYAYYLDYHKKDWKYEVELFTFKDGTTYRPDFYIYDEEGKLKEIVEVKGTGNKDSGIRKVEKLKREFNIDVKLMFQEDLVKLYQNHMRISFNKAKHVWIDTYGAILCQDVSGDRNPMYGVKHSEKTKRLISEKGKKRFANGDYNYLGKNLVEYNKRTNYAASKQPKSKRVKQSCANPDCSVVFIKTDMSPKKYCTKQCAGSQTYIFPTQANSLKSESIRDKAKEYILKWALENKELVLNTSYNKISSLNDMYYNVNKYFGIKDKRIVTKSVLGKDGGRKEMLRYLKQYVQ